METNSECYCEENPENCEIRLESGDLPMLETEAD